MAKERSKAAAAEEEFEFEDEEMKMEKFYELIRSFNEARNLHQRSFRYYQNYDQYHNSNNNQTQEKKDVNYNNNNNNNSSNNKTKKGLGSDADGHAIWMPSFKWEDFRDVHSHDHQDTADQDRQVVVSHKSDDFDFLNAKKRKINDVDDDDDDDVTPAHQLKNQSPPGIDLNLAL